MLYRVNVSIRFFRDELFRHSVAIGILKGEHDDYLYGCDVMVNSSSDRSTSCLKHNDSDSGLFYGQALRPGRGRVPHGPPSPPTTKRNSPKEFPHLVLQVSLSSHRPPLVLLLALRSARMSFGGRPPRWSALLLVRPLPILLAGGFVWHRLLRSFSVSKLIQ